MAIRHNPEATALIRRRTLSIQQLVSDAENCVLCYRMTDCRRVLSDRNGDWNADVLFVAEAPGRLGAEVTGIPLFGDRTGDRFEQLLAAMRWRRSQVFITNAVLCNPKNDQGKNDSPKRLEIENCSSFLRRTITVIDPTLVVALGRIALIALDAIESHHLELKKSAGKVFPWNNRHLGILYHPGPRTEVHRKWNLQIGDAKAVASFACYQLGIKPSQVEDDSLFTRDGDVSEWVGSD